MNLPIPIHDFCIYPLSYSEETCRLILFGGQCNEKVVTRPYIIDLALDLDKKKTFNNEFGKVYYPICPIDDKSFYVFGGY